MSLTRALPLGLVGLLGFIATSSITAAPRSQPSMITVDVPNAVTRTFYGKGTQYTQDPGGIVVPANEPAWQTFGFKPGDIVLHDNGDAVGELVRLQEGLHYFDILRNKKPLVLRVIVHPAPRKSHVIDEERFERLVVQLDPSNGVQSAPVSDARGPSGVRLTNVLLGIYLSTDVGDVVRSIDHQPIRTDADLVAALKSLRVGITELVIDRAGDPILISLVRKAPIDLTAIRKISPTKFEVTRAFADVIKADTDILARKLTAAPNIRGGKPHGFAIYDLKPDAPARALGLLDGDIVLDVDGNRIDSYSEVSHATSQLEYASSLVVHIERKGKPVTLTYVIN